MTHKTFQAAIAPKVQGSWNLHEALGTDLEFFILLSSIASISGNRGQTNYAAANSFEDAFPRYLMFRGMKAASINLGRVRSVGYIAENKEKISKHSELINVS
jgi:hypothetical protein